MPRLAESKLQLSAPSVVKFFFFFPITLLGLRSYKVTTRPYLLIAFYKVFYINSRNSWKCCCPKILAILSLLTNIYPKVTRWRGYIHGLEEPKAFGNLLNVKNILQFHRFQLNKESHVIAFLVTTGFGQMRKDDSLRPPSNHLKKKKTWFIVLLALWQVYRNFDNFIFHVLYLRAVQI